MKKFEALMEKIILSIGVIISIGIALGALAVMLRL